MSYFLPFSIIFVILLGLLFSVVVLKSPVVLGLILLLFSIFPIIAYLNSNYQIQLAEKIIAISMKFLKKSNLLVYFLKIFRFVNITCSYNVFKIGTILLSLLIVLYILFSRSCYLLLVNGVSLPLHYYFIFFLLSLFVLIRATINFSRFIFFFLLVKEKDLICLYVPEAIHYFPTEVPSTGDTTTTNINSYSSLNLNKNSHPNPVPQLTKRLTFANKCGIAIGLFGIGVAGFGAYYTRLSALEAIYANDLKAREMGLISESELRKRHPNRY